MGIYAVTGVTNPSLRARVAGLFGAPYTANQMGYDLARLRLNGLIERIEGTNSYVLTNDRLRVAMFYTKVHDRVLRPLIASDQPPAPPELRDALKRWPTPAAPCTKTANMCSVDHPR